MKTGLNGTVVTEGKGIFFEGVSLIENEGATFEDTPFGRDDLEDIISDLQEEYYRLSAGKDVVLKIQIADLIDRLCQLRKTMKE